MLYFPDLPGQAWPIKKRTRWNTQLDESVSGRETRLARWRYPKYEFELTFNALSSSEEYPGAEPHSLQNLVSFFNDCQGRANPFVFVDRTDFFGRNEPLGVGDGAKVAFTVQRTLGRRQEPVGWVNNVAAVRVAGAPVSGWTLTQPNTVTLASAPAAGQVVTIDFWFGYLCRFDDDVLDTDQIMADLFQGLSVKFKSVRSA